MTRLPVTSSQIKSVGYNLGTQTLELEFTPSRSQPQGSVYQYQGVPQELYEALVGAESVGSYFYKNIKPFKEKYPYTRIQ